jgi:hypothetical protein
MTLPKDSTGMDKDAASDLMSEFDGYSKNWILVELLADGTISVDDIRRVSNEEGSGI